MAQQEEEELIPGVVHDVVVTEILPRVPWYSRRAMLMVSKAWKEAVEGLDPELIREHTRVPLLMRAGSKWAFVDMQDGTRVRLPLPPSSCSRYCSSCSQCHCPDVKLPRSKYIFADDITTLITSDGKVFAWRAPSYCNVFCTDCAKAAFKLDLWKGTWELVRTASPAWKWKATRSAYLQGSFYRLANRGSILQQYNLETGRVSEFAAPRLSRELFTCGASGQLYAVSSRRAHGQLVISQFDLAGGWRVLSSLDKVYKFYGQQFVMSHTDNVVHYNIRTQQWVELQGKRPRYGPTVVTQCSSMDTSHNILFYFEELGSAEFWKVEVDLIHNKAYWRQI